MSNVPEHLIEKIRERGITPGALVESSIHGRWTVPDIDTWKYHDSGYHKGGVSCTPVEYGGGAWIFFATRNEWATVITPAPSEGLKEGMATECSPEMRAAIIAEAKKLGLQHPSCGNDGTTGVYVLNGKAISFFGVAPDDFTLIPDHEFLRLLRLTAKQPKPIKIGSNTVEFQEDGSVKFGCTTVDFVTLGDIYQRAQKQKS